MRIFEFCFSQWLPMMSGTFFHVQLNEKKGEPVRVREPRLKVLDGGKKSRW